MHTACSRAEWGDDNNHDHVGAAKPSLHRLSVGESDHWLAGPRIDDVDRRAPLLEVRPPKDIDSFRAGRKRLAPTGGYRDDDIYRGRLPPGVLSEHGWRCPHGVASR